MKKITIIIFALILVFPLYSQERLIQLTYSIVDTSLTKTEQAKSIYSWITNNISYDTKQLKNGLKYNSPIQTINRKKAVCFGYSNLFYEMCKILDIESYVINGYSKGFGYTKGDDFLKADHSWNIVYADSNWFFIDATWGSGYLGYTYDFKSKLKQKLYKNKGIKTKIIFHKNPNYNYFDTTMVKFSSTHYPLDAKWQLLNYPVSYNTFISDTLDNSEFLDYKREISYIRNMEVEYQSFIEGINSVKYNPFNKFDIAYQYYYQAGQINITNKIIYDSLLLSKLLKAYDYYDSSSHYLKEFKILNSDNYKKKKNSQKTNFKIEINILKQTAKIPSSYNNRSNREYDKLLNLDMKFNSSIKNIEQTITNIPKSVFYYFDTVSTIDTLLLYSYIDKVKNNRQKINSNFIELKKILCNIDSLSTIYRTFNDAILEPLKTSCSILNNLVFSIDQMSEYQVYNSSSEMNVSFNNYKKANYNKTEAHNQLVINFKSFQKIFETTDKSLNSSLELYSKLSKLLGDNFKFKTDAENINIMIGELYELYLDALNNIKLDNETRINILSNQNDVLSIFGSDGLSNITNQLSQFYDYTLNENDKAYNENEDLYREINNDIKRKRTLIKTIIRDINKKQRLLQLVQ